MVLQRILGNKGQKPTDSFRVPFLVRQGQVGRAERQLVGGYHMALLASGLGQKKCYYHAI